MTKCPWNFFTSNIVKQFFAFLTSFEYNFLDIQYASFQERKKSLKYVQYVLVHNCMTNLISSETIINGFCKLVLDHYFA